MGWYDSGWLYRKEVTIDNTSNSNNLTDYQVKVTLNSTNFDFSKAKSDGADIRFTDDDGTTLLNHWIEKWDTSGEEAILWVKVPSIPASSNKTIYLYYGNPDASSTSDGDDTFIFFDDFESYAENSNIDGQGGWTTKRVGGSGHAKVVIKNGRKHLSLSSTDQATGVIHSVNLTNAGISVEGRVIADDWDEGVMFQFGDGNTSGGELGSVDNGYDFVWWGWGGTASKLRRRYNNGGDDLFLDSISDSAENGVYYRLKHTWLGENLKGYRDGNLKLSGTDSYYTSRDYLHLAVWAGATWAIDWVFVRKYTDPEPTTTVGNEETNFCISGQVTLSGNPVQGAVVRAICQDDETYANDTTTDENGNYTITGLVSNKKYHIIVEYTDGSGNKYNAESKWDITPSEGS